ncbi:MAG: response regulator [Proteobacteria bacterium]|uniref:response regulator n=1 Tax=Aquabacterium sp. TaxID=1872578 RepID=UPI0035C6739C|nr:response regulator [Pseudomonadota bacterium]
MSLASPGASPLEPDTATANSSLRHTLRKLWQTAAVWTVAVACVTVWWAHRDISHHRQEALQAAEVRLDSLHGAIDLSFQQLGALPVALSRQNALVQFLQSPATTARGLAPGAAPAEPPAATQERLRKLSLQDPAWRNMSQKLQDTAQDLHLDRILVNDPDGFVLADSDFDRASSAVGLMNRGRRYHMQAMEHPAGKGFQFAVSQTRKNPGFYFSARVGSRDAPEGVVVVVQGASAFNRLFEDADRRVLLTDEQGVVLAGNHGSDLLGRSPLAGAGTSDREDDRKLYQREPAPLPWTMDTARVGTRAVPVVNIGGQAHMAVSKPLPQGRLTAWVLVPLGGEASVMFTWGAVGLAVLLCGYWMMAMRAQRLRRMDALRQGKQTLADMAHALPLTVFRWRQPRLGSARFDFIGEGVQALLGLDPEVLRAQPHLSWQLMGVGDVRPPEQPVEFSVQHGDRTVWVRCESRRTQQADGSSVWSGYWADITARKEVEARTQAVFQHTPSAIIFYNPEQGITRCNPSAVALFGGHSEQSLLGLMPSQPPLSPPGTFTPELAATIERIRQSGHAETLEWRHTRLNGEPFDAEVLLIPFVHNGRQQFGGIVQDITARKQTEHALRSAQQAAEAATLAKTHFLANMSHEIRTPMNAIMGMSHLALLDELPPRARNYIEKVHRAAANLLQILNDVLDVSKIESGKLELEHTDFQLESVINHMADVLGVRAEEKGMELLFTAPPDIPTALIGDPIRLGQVLINLGTNAIKFTEHGEVVIGCEAQRQDDQGVVLHFWVRDSGIGMSDEQVERLFQPFTQGDNSTTRQYGGTGLGLAISRQLVEMMGGKIWVDSQVGKGSTFHFTARFGVQAQPATRRALLASEMHGKRLLLVDDNPAAREVLGDMARRMGLDVEVSDSGEHALGRMRAALAEGRPHHILLSDWKMPGMDGIAFARHALSMPPGQRPCVLLVTAFAREEAMKAAEGVGLAGVLNKPVTPSTLLDTLGRVLGQDAPAQPGEPKTQAMLKQAQRQLAGAKVLLVEDQPLNQELACDLLERAGLSVVTASNGQECLDMLAREGPFDGVLMDCQMPVMDGYTATERIRANPAWQDLPVIAMTASAMAADRERVLRCGMNDHITKPLDLARMFGIMARWITPARPAAADGPGLTTGSAALHLASLDTADGLSRCMGNLDLYRRLLKGFARTQRDFAQQFEAVAEHADQALALVHTLKGLAGNIGARTLLERSTQLETTLRSPEADPPSPAEVRTALATTLEALDTVLADIDRMGRQASEVDWAEGPDRDVLQGHWARLMRLVSDQDAHSREMLQDLLSSWPALRQHPQVMPLKQALDRYDFDQARDVLAQMQS